MAEQLVTGIDEFYSIRALTGRYYGLFPPSTADQASVLLLTVVWTVVSLLFYALLRDGAGRLIVVGLFGVFAVTELHHVVEALASRGYDPGVITCVPYAVVGGLLVAAVVRECKRRYPIAITQRSIECQ